MCNKLEKQTREVWTHSTHKHTIHTDTDKDTDTHTREVWIPPQQLIDCDAVSVPYMREIVVAHVAQCCSVAALC